MTLARDGDDTARTPDEARFEAALRGLASVGRTLRSDQRFMALSTGDVFHDTLVLLAPTIGVTVKPSAADAPGLTIAARLAAFGHVSGFRTRAVKLRGEWWRNPGSAMMGVDRRDGSPVALVPTSKGYVALRPNREEEPVDGKAASNIDSAAYALYETLPEHADPKSFLRLAVRGGASDIKRILLAAFGAALLALVVPVIFGQAVEIAIPEGRLPLLFELTLMLVAAALSASLLQGFRHREADGTRGPAPSGRHVGPRAAPDKRFLPALADR
jgi:hypothetical protein